MISADEFRIYVIRPVLRDLNMWSRAAENLLMGTAAVESNLAYHLVQIGGPALGPFQMEPSTRDWLLNQYLEARPALRTLVAHASGTTDLNKASLITNLAFAAAMARLYYWSRPDPLPEADDLQALGQYWKDHYNTKYGKGTVAKFVLKYQELVKHTS